MAEFKINLSQLDGIIANINTAIKEIDPKAVGIFTPTQCKGTVLSTYVEKMRDISKLLTEYKQLLEKDVNDLKNSREKLSEMDKKITFNIKT